MPLNKNQLIKKTHVRGSVQKIYSGDGLFSSFVSQLPLNRVKEFLMKNAVNFALNKLPLPELHLLDGTKKYSFCGPGTKLQNRIEYDKEGNPIKVLTPPINELDGGCMSHDLAYEKFTDIPHRNLADIELKRVAEHVINNPNSTKSDIWNAFLVKKVMDYKIDNKV